MFLIPYNPGFHWVLLVIHIASMTIFWLDSLHDFPNIYLAFYINIGLQTMVIDRKRRPKLTWDYIRCPKQPRNAECGYYVMRFMRDFMEDYSKPIQMKMKEICGKREYKSRETNEVRNEFIQFIQEYIQ